MYKFLLYLIVLLRYCVKVVLNKLFFAINPPVRMGNVLKVAYSDGQRIYNVYLPFTPEPDQNATLIKQGEEIDITQQGGVPFLVCAKDFQAEKIILHGLTEDYEFIGKEVPSLDGRD